MTQTSLPRGTHPSTSKPILFRFLEVGEIIQEGDENPDDQACKWEPVSHWAIGLPVSALYKTIRRQVVTTGPNPVDVGVLQRMQAWVMSERLALQTSDTCFKSNHLTLKSVGEKLQQELAALETSA